MRPSIPLLLFVLIAAALTLTTNTRTANADPVLTGTVLGDTYGAGTASGQFLLASNSSYASTQPSYLCPSGGITPDVACLTPGSFWHNGQFIVGDTVDLWVSSSPPGGNPFDHFAYSGTGLGHFTDDGPATCPIVGGSCEHYTATAGGESETGTVTLVFTSPPTPGVPSMGSVGLVDASVLGLGFAVAVLGVVYVLNHRKQTRQTAYPVSPR